MKLNKKEFNKQNFPVVKATAAIILRKGNKILLTKRKIDKEKGKWCLPGGHIEIGETALNAVKRELKEETGLSTKNLKFQFYFDEIIPRLKVHALSLIFSGSPSGKIKLNNECSDYKYYTRKEIKNLNIAFTNKDIINKYFKK